MILEIEFVLMETLMCPSQCHLVTVPSEKIEIKYNIGLIQSRFSRETLFMTVSLGGSTFWVMTETIPNDGDHSKRRRSKTETIQVTAIDGVVLCMEGTVTVEN